MENAAVKRTCWIATLGLVVLCCAWTMPAWAVDVKIGGGEALDLSSFQVVHKEAFDTGKSQNDTFWGVLDVGEKVNDPWSGVLTKGLYALTHTGRAGAVRYYFRQNVDGMVGTLSEHALSVDVSGTMNDKTSGAGLLYAFNPQTKYYLAFIKGPGRTYAIYKRNAEGFRKITSGSSNAVRPNQANQLAIVPSHSMINFYINGTHIAGIKDNESTSGGAGLLAISSGMFLFDNFTLYNSPKPHAGSTHQMQNRQAQAAPAAAKAPARPVEQKPARSMVKPATTKALGPPSGMTQSYNKVLKPGMSKQEVIQLMGQPAYMRGSRFFYDLAPKGTEKGGGTLVIQFDENDNLLNHKALEE